MIYNNFFHLIINRYVYKYKHVQYVTYFLLKTLPWNIPFFEYKIHNNYRFSQIYNKHSVLM